MKTSQDTLLNEIASDFNQFLLSGNLCAFTSDIDPNLNVKDIERLLNIHFVLTQKNDQYTYGVIDFVKQLPGRLRRIKTNIEYKSEKLYFETRGKVNWHNTFKLRATDPFLFECESRQRNYDISENIVLKALLQIIYKIIHEDMNLVLKKDYQWFKEWIENEGELAKLLKDIFLKNVYLKRIDISNTNIPNRMIQKALKSRIPIYREAATLLLRYKKLMSYDIDSSEAKELLRNTFIKPEKTEVLFELYWAIRIIREFRDVKFHLIEPHKNVIAIWEDENHKYTFYHDSQGNFNFKEDTDLLDNYLTDKDNYFGRQFAALQQLKKMTNLPDKHIWSGRPDLILEKRDHNDKLISVYIGEVKYTNSKDYAITGLKELLTYIALIKNNFNSNCYIEEYQNLYCDLKTIKGLLFTDFIEDFNVNIENEPISIVMYGQDFNL